ncbi:MAG: M28 family peptidase [Candidatus Acidiferrales bacterium]
MRVLMKCGAAGAICFAAIFAVAACGHDTGSTNAASAKSPAPAVGSGASQAGSDAAPPASATGGFDGVAAYNYTAKLVSFGPRPPASDAIHHTRDYIRTELQSFGCQVDEHDFHASTPVGDLAMKNIVAKVPGAGQGVILLLTHYDTLRMDNFVGAVDGGSSSGLMLEMARVLCGEKKQQPNSVWIAFLDGEEALVDWNKNNDNTYGSREMAASLANSGELKRIRAVVLADMVGPKNLKIQRDSYSTPWLTSLVWKTADRLGYKDIFVPEETGIEDDHQPFLARKVPAVDIIDLADYQAAGYWHTTQDTMDKVSARSLAIVGYVILDTVSELQRKFH